jgi:CDGSH-type Zn-finger protein
MSHGDAPRPPQRRLPPRSVTIRCRIDGPLVVELSPDCPDLGLSLRVTDHEGREHPLPAGRPLALCRCGHSARKPFCDGAHKTIPFTAQQIAPSPSAPDAPSANQTPTRPLDEPETNPPIEG